MNKIDKLIVFLVLIWSLLAGFFAFNDLSISETIVTPNSDWAIFLEQYGELPGAVVIILGIIIFSSHYNNPSFFKLAAIQFIFIVALSIIFLYTSFVLLFNITSSSNTFFDYSIFLLAGSLILSLLLVTFFRKINVDSSLITVSKIIIWMAFSGYLITVQTIKIFWGRVRYRDLDLLRSNFTEWYIANGANGHQSFPSGHAAMGWMLLPVFLLFLNGNKYIKKIVFFLIIFIASSIAFSRVVIGAHYASDALFGSFFMIITFLILYRKYYLRN